MSITGRGDAIGEINKDDEPEISSTTRDSGDIAQNISNPSTINVLPSDAQPSKLPNAEDINDIVLASIDTPPVANVDTGMATEAGLESGDHSVNASVKVVDPTLASSSKIVLDEKNNTNAESNPDVYSSSLDEEFTLEWDDVDENTPVSDEVLKLLDQEIEDERKAMENVQTKEIESGEKLINTLELQKDLENVIQSSEKVAETQNDADDVEMTPLNESLEQSRKIIDTDNFTEDKVQDVEMKDLNELVEKNELMKSNDGKMNTEQSNKGGNDTMESKLDNIDTSTCDKDDKTLINPVLNKSIADNSIPVTHIEPSIESSKSAGDGKTELELEALRDMDKIGLKHEELQVQEISGEFIESSVTDNLHMKDEICDALFDSSIVDVEPTSSNPDDSGLTVKTELTSENVKCTSSNPDDSVLTVKTELTSENVKCTSSNPDDSVLTVKTELTSENVKCTSSNPDDSVLTVKTDLTSENLIENSGPTQQGSNISEPLEIDHDNQTMISPEFPLNVSLEQAEKERIGIDKHLSQCSDGDSMLDTSINPNVHHQLNKPNAMLDIPTQELSDIEAEMDDDDSYNRSGQKSQESMKMEVSIEQMSSENVIKDNAEPATEITTATDLYEIEKPCSPERNLAITDNLQLSPTKSTEQNVISESESKFENVEKLQITDDVQLSTPKPIQETAVKLFKFESDVSPIRSTHDEPSTTPKKNIHEEISLKIEFENDESSYKSPKCDLEPSTSTDEFGNETPLISNINSGNDVTSTITTVDEQPSTSKSTQITDDQPSSSKSTQDDTQPSASAVNKDINMESLLISKIKFEKDESTTSLVEHTGDEQPSTSQPNQISDDLPLTSKSTHDNIQTSTLVVMEENDISTPTKTEEVLPASISVEEDIQPTISNSTQDDIQPNRLKSTQDNIQTSTTVVMEENEISPTKPAEKLLPTSISTQDEIQLSTSKLTLDDKQSLSKSTQDDTRPCTSKSTQDDIQPSTSKSTQDDIKPCTSKSTNDVMQPSTSKSTQDDIQPSTSKFAHLQPLSVNLIDSEIPSTSQDSEKQSASKLNELTSDMAEVQEATDSLGLLAESSRVMDDDDEEPEDPEPENDDDDDDDDDFYTYEETSQMVVEDDSVGPPPRMDPKESGTLGLGDMQTGPRLEFDEGTMDIDDFDLENELPDCESGGDDILEEIEYKAREPEIIDADAHKELPANKNSSCPPEKIMTILEKVLGHHNLPDTSVKAPLAMKIINYVDIEDGSSDSDDVLEVSKSDGTGEVSVNIPKEVEVMATSAAGSTTEITTREGEVVISGIPKPAAPKLPTINTSEVTVSTAKYSTSIDIPETFIPPSIKDEIFDLESDEEEPPKDPPAKVKDTTKEVVKKKKSVKTNRMCANPVCAGDPLSGDASTKYYPTDPRTATYFSLKKRGVVCHQCRELAQSRAQRLIDGIKDLRPLLDLDMDAPLQQLVTISDSESDSDEGGAEDSEVIGGEAAKFLEEHLADMFNETWSKYKLESRLESAEANILAEMEKMEESVKELDAIINDCQKTTDGTRSEFYGMFHIKRKHLGAILINDTPFSYFQVTDKEVEEGMQTLPARYPKRKATASQEPPAKKLAIPLGYAPIEPQEMKVGNESAWDPGTGDDDRDISVVKLSAEAAPSDLPPCGEAALAPLRTGMATYAMRNAFGSWLKGKVVEIQPKVNGFTQCKVKFEHKVKNPCKVLAARCLAYLEPSEVRMTIGTRIIALFKDPQNAARREAFYSGVVAEIPNPVNNYRYLVFFDDGYAQYVHHRDTRLVCESSVRVWEEVHPFIRDFICKYLRSYPERPMVRLHTGERLKTEWNGKWWDSKVLRVDASIALIHFDEDDRTEWIYRGSTRLAPLYLELQAAQLAGERHRTRLPRSKAQTRSNMPYVEYTRSDSQIQIEELRRQKALMRRSTAFAASAVQDPESEKAYSRVVYYTPKNAVRPHKWVPHTCSPACKRTDVLSLTELRSYNPLSKPLLSGWERQLCRFKLQREVMYRAPCGRRLRNMAELHRYLRAVDSDYGVELFEFNSVTHCLGEYVTNTCYVGKKDLSHGKENMPVPCVNNHDESLPEFCSYNTERTPTAGVPLNLDPDFLCGCDCTDDCEDKSKCACWKMTLEGARTIGLTSPKVGYVYRRLPEPLPSGIYECNSRCQCKKTCLNRVAQRPLQLKLQVFKTLKRGWGIRAVNDVPKGSFLCVYAGNLLTDATANLDGLNEGDEYLAELDYIEVVEAMKEGYEDDVPDADKKLDKKALGQRSESESNDEQTESSEDEVEQAGQLKDADFQPGYVAQTNVIFKKSLRKRELKNNAEETEPQKEEPKKTDDCITISDDEEVREPSRFTAQADMVDKSFKSKNSSRVSVRTLYGKDEACYIMDAKVQGNIGRYLNHSCCPNVFVQNVFVDTHDPRFPWVAFFALSDVKAGTELTWNYNYDVGSVPGKVLYCYCGEANCRGRLL